VEVAQNRELPYTEPGTTITLFLKDDVELDLIKELKRYARHVEFPVYVEDEENAETIVDQGYDFNFVDYMDPLDKPYADELNPYVIDFEKEDIEGVKGKLIFMFLKDENGGYGFQSKNLPAAGHLCPFVKLAYETQIKKRGLLSQDGILIKEIKGFEFIITEIFPMWLGSGSILFDVNLEEESKIDLTIDRNDVVFNEKLFNLKTKIEAIIIDHIEKIFSQKHLVTAKDKNTFMKCFFRCFGETSFLTTLPFFLKRLITFECSVNGKIKYLTYNELKDCWGYFFFSRQPFEEIDGKKTFRKNTLKDIKNAVEKAYSEDPVIYSKSQDYGDLTGCLLEFSGDHIIVTNKELKFSFDKFFLLPSNKEEKEYGFTFEGDYKDRFGTLTNQHLGIAPNINHPFIQLVNKNRDMFTGKDKEDHEFYIETLLEMNIFLTSIRRKGY
jgi:hypothetical protein